MLINMKELSVANTELSPPRSDITIAILVVYIDLRIPVPELLAPVIVEGI
jgi:hypothetical protein